MPRVSPLISARTTVEVTRVSSRTFPYVSATAGWILTEMGRQPWIVQNLLKTSDAVSTGLSTATIALSLTVFVALYTALGVVDLPKNSQRTAACLVKRLRHRNSARSSIPESDTRCSARSRASECDRNRRSFGHGGFTRPHSPP